jgi:glyoxylase-like metal-dependent hydrolase (beta-lactamase superfamily II)
MIEQRVEEVQPGIYLLRGEARGSHSYLIRAAYRNVLIDSGLDQNFLSLQEELFGLGLKLRDIDIVINTHKHLDHMGSTRYFQEFSLIAVIGSQPPRSLYKTITSPFTTLGT